MPKVEWQDAVVAGRLLGKQFVLNELVAYISLCAADSELAPHINII